MPPPERINAPPSAPPPEVNFECITIDEGENETPEIEILQVIKRVPGVKYTPTVPPRKNNKKVAAVPIIPVVQTVPVVPNVQAVPHPTPPPVPPRVSTVPYVPPTTQGIHPVLYPMLPPPPPPPLPTPAVPTVPHDKYASGGDKYEEQRRFEIVLSVRALELESGWGKEDQIERILRGDPFKIAAKVMALVKKVRSGGIISADEEVWVNSKKGYFFFKLLHDLNKHRLGRVTGTTQDMKEICTEVQKGPNICKTCGVEHMFEYHKDICLNRTKNGPRKLDWVKLNRADWEDVVAVLVGWDVFLYTPGLVGPNILNLGSQLKPSYSTGISFCYPVLTNEGSLALELYKRLCIIGLKSNLPVFVEFYMDEFGQDSDWKSNIFGFMRVIMNLQPYYGGKIIVAIPPAIPAERETYTSYTKAKRLRTKLSRYAKVIGIMTGVAVWVPHVQTFKDGSDPNFYREPSWDSEYLFGPNMTICGEYLTRLDIEFCAAVNKLNRFDMPEQF